MAIIIRLTLPDELCLNAVCRERRHKNLARCWAPSARSERRPRDYFPRGFRFSGIWSGHVAAKTGRPSSYTQEVADEICMMIADGKSLDATLRVKGMPSRGTVIRWTQDNPQFQADYARAREHQADTFADAVVQIADNPKLTPENKRVMIDARKWAAGKQRPTKYGDKVELGGNFVVKLEQDSTKL